MTNVRRRNPIDLAMWLVPIRYAVFFGLVLAFFSILALFWGDYVLLPVDELRGHGRSMLEGLGTVWWIFAWGFGLSLVIGVLARHVPRTHGPGEILIKGWWISINAGFFEELIYRWLAFFIAMIVLPFIDLITFGLWGWLYREVLVPLANWTTLGALEPQLLGHPNWVFGAAIVSASIGFRNAHGHLGFFGWVHSWFLGMILFWLMFNYGLETAVVAHILYDVVVFTGVALTYTWRPDPARYVFWYG